MSEQPQIPSHWGKAYEGQDITVYYDARRCIHYAACVRGLPQVFNPQARPWIQADAAQPAELAEVVRHCPTGALHYRWHGHLKAGQPEQPDVPTTVEVRQDGPLFLRGDLHLQTPDGPRQDVRAALCRCGASENKPYCDGSHRKAEFKAAGGPVLNDQ